MVLSVTSREPRESSDLPGEYRCNVSRKDILRLKRGGKCLWAEVAHGNIYVTLLADVDQAIERKPVSFMQLLPVSVRNIREYAPGRVLSIFVLSPDEDELRRRLRERGEPDDAIEKRMSDCRKWEEEALLSVIPYEYVTNSGTIEEAVSKVEKVISSYT